MKMSDPKEAAEEMCKPRCIKFLAEYNACEERIKDEKLKDVGHCTGQAFDLWGCVDKCAADKTFAVLK